MSDLLALPQFRLSVPEDFNRLKEALAAALQRTDSEQAWDLTEFAYLEEIDTYISRDAANNLIMVDPNTGIVTLAAVASGPGTPPTPAYLDGPYVLPAEAFTPVANRIYLIPCWADKALTLTDGRIYVATTGAANFYVGLYGTDGTRLAQSASTALSVSGWQNIAFTASYAAAAGLQLYLAYQQNAAAGTLGPAPIYPSCCKYVDTTWGLPASLTIPPGVLANGVKGVGVMGVITGGLY